MFTAMEFDNVKDATEYVKKVLAELNSPKELEFQVIHSMSESECSEDGGSWDRAADLLLNYIRELNDQCGYMLYDDSVKIPVWDFVESSEVQAYEMVKLIYKPAETDELYVRSDDGLIVLYNQFALCENEFPVVVMKRAIWKKDMDRIEKMLKSNEVGNDYTSKISPAIYVEIFESDETPVTPSDIKNLINTYSE
jgi:hypothetical protein